MIEADIVKYCVMLRSDMENGWEFIAGGGEGDETPLEAAIRETMEESGIASGEKFTILTTQGYIPTFYFSPSAQEAWGNDTCVIPNYAFAVEVIDLKVTLSQEHTEYRWVTYDEAIGLLKFDINKTGLWELKRRIECGNI
jgi:dATP pyrophosphohydrolase